VHVAVDVAGGGDRGTLALGAVDGARVTELDEDDGELAAGSGGIVQSADSVTGERQAVAGVGLGSGQPVDTRRLPGLRVRPGEPGEPGHVIKGPVLYHENKHPTGDLAPFSSALTSSAKTWPKS
jgi:hypothetical protein